MADPVSFAAAVLALAEAAFKLGRLIARCQNAPAEILALNNEANNLRLVLNRIDEAYPSELKLPLLGALSEADRKIKQMYAIIKSLKLDESRLSTVRRVRWSVMRGKVCNLLAELREIRMQLNTLMAVDTV